MPRHIATPRWRSASPTDVISFDCDATLSTIEGIDWLAEQAGHGPAVEAMTRVAMQETGINDSLYRDRLDLVRPSAKSLQSLVLAYHENITPDTEGVIRALIYSGKTVCVLSAGIHEAVRPFANQLGVDSSQIRAVPLIFDEEGQYENYDDSSILKDMDGKAKWLEAHYDNSVCLHVGDGLNDVSVKAVGVRLLGFGGGQFHPHIAKHCSEYIVENSLAPVLSLTLTTQEIRALPEDLALIVAKGDEIIANHGVRFEQTLGEGVC